MILRRVAIIAATIVLLLIAAFWFSRAKGNNTPFSSPTAIRTNEDYTRAHSAPTNAPPFTPQVSTSITVQRSPVSLTVSYPAGESPFVDVDYDPIGIHKAQATDTIQLGDGTIRLAYIAVATAPPANPGQFNFGVTPRFYTADLQPVTRTDPLRLFMLQNGPQDLVVQRLPAARFIFACSNIAGFLPLRFRVFDARTHYTLSTSYHHDRGSFPNTFNFNTDLNLWHQTPIQVVGTVAIGPIVNYSLQPTEGAEAIFPGGAIKLLAVSNGYFQEATTTRGPTNTASFKIVQGRRTQHWSDEFSLMFFCWPRAFQLPFEFEFFDDSGKQMNGRTWAFVDRIAVAEVTGSPERLKEIRLKHYPNIHRLVVTIPELPGLPEQNRNLQNLFDVHLPYVRRPKVHDIQKELGDAVQMQVQYIPLGRHAYSNGSPVVLVQSNTTARAILEQLDSCLPYQSDQLISDPEKNEITMRRHFLTRPMQFVKRVLKVP